MDMRRKHREWKNGKYPHWNRRITWYAEEYGVNIRLRMLDEERQQNVYPKTVQEAERLWEAFKGGVSVKELCNAVSLDQAETLPD